MSRKAAISGRWSTCAEIFRRDGREEADDLLRRRSGDADSPRMLAPSTKATPDWLSFFMFTYFTDRDGKMQLHSLAQSGFDPRRAPGRFMLDREAHHMCRNGKRVSTAKCSASFWMVRRSPRPSAGGSNLIADRSPRRS